MKKITIDKKTGRKRVQTVNKLASKTDQQWKDVCDVNLIIKRFMKTGQVTHLAKLQPSYADVSQIPDLKEAMEQVKLAEYTFGQLPAHIRKRFGHSPEAMIEFLSNPENDPEAVKLGLKNKIVLKQDVSDENTPPTKEGTQNGDNTGESQPDKKSN